MVELVGVVVLLVGGLWAVAVFHLRGADLSAFDGPVGERFSRGELDARFVPTAAGGVAAQWVLAPGADANRRLLYIHGGAFTLGSPLSHRTVTSRFSAISGSAVLAIDYRLMPEHPRRAGIDDCRSAYLCA